MSDYNLYIFEKADPDLTSIETEWTQSFVEVGPELVSVTLTEDGLVSSRFTEPQTLPTGDFGVRDAAAEHDRYLYDV